MVLFQKKIFYFVFCAWLVISGCLCVPPGLSPLTQTPTSLSFKPEPDHQKTEPSNEKPVETNNPSLNAKPDQPNPGGPWLLISSDKGLWSANSDGSGLKKLTNNSLSSIHLDDAVQPGGNLVAVITSSGDEIHQLALNLFTIPDGKVTKITDLTSGTSEPSANTRPGDPEFEAIRAITEQHSLAWSPDGKKLAFIGFMDGPSADLYIYDTGSRKINRLTMDKAQDFSPSWSPDSQNIVVLSAESFGTGAGLNMGEVWLAKADGSDTSILYNPESSGETIHGWVDSKTVLLSSWSMICGNNVLRLMNIDSRSINIIYKECFSDAAAGPSGNYLFANPSDVFLRNINDDKPNSLVQMEATQVEWDEDNSVYVVRFGNGRLATFDRSGKDQQMSPNQTIGQVSAYGAIWAWTSINEETPGVWISGLGLETKRIFAQKAHSPIWDPKNNLLFFSEKQIFRTEFPDYSDPKPVAQFKESVQEIKWVGLNNAP